MRPFHLLVYDGRGDSEIGRFLAEHRDVCFCQVSRGVAQVLVPHGFLVNEMGYETRIDLAAYDFKGQKRRNFRKAMIWRLVCIAGCAGVPNTMEPGGRSSETPLCAATTELAPILR